MPVQDLLQTILSTPAEQLAFLLGVVLAAVTVYVAESALGYVVASFIVFAAAVPLLPVDVAGEWHYWPAASVVVFLFGLYKLGPETRFSRRFE